MKNNKYVIPALLTPQAAFDHFRAAALKCPPVVCRADIPVVLANVDAAFRVISPRVEELSTLLPTHDLRLTLQMPNLARALLYAGGRFVTLASSQEIQKKLVACRRHREPMLLIAEGLALLGLMPAERVAKIRAGNGPYDSARDVIDLVGLYRECATAIAGKQPFDEASLTEAETIAAWLLSNITPTGAAKPATADTSEAARIRDGLWGMMLQCDPKLRVVASVLFEDKADELVPALQSRVMPQPTGNVAAPPTEASPVVTSSPDAQIHDDVAQVRAATGNSTPPAPMRPQTSRVREQGARARRRR